MAMFEPRCKTNMDVVFQLSGTFLKKQSDLSVVQLISSTRWEMQHQMHQSWAAFGALSGFGLGGLDELFNPAKHERFSQKCHRLFTCIYII